MCCKAVVLLWRCSDYLLWNGVLVASSEVSVWCWRCLGGRCWLPPLDRQIRTMAHGSAVLGLIAGGSWNIPLWLTLQQGGW